MEFSHKPIMVDEVIEGLRIRPDGIYVDGTLGGGGHSFEIAKRLGDDGRLIGIDQDGDAVKAASKRLEPYKDRVCIIRGNYCEMKRICEEAGIESVSGILLDLGVSSFQFDQGERGFSYRFDSPLDMRMDQRQSLSAYDVVNSYSETALFHLIRDYGEERFAKNIAKHIVRARDEEEIKSTGRLAEIIKGAIPMGARKTGGHPAKRTFQAIRIEVNRELDVLSEGLSDMVDLLEDGGRLCVITFHSLEDRIVKRAFRDWENPCTCPPEFPVCVCGRKPKGRAVSRKPIRPAPEEIEANSRAKSSKLRVFEKIGSKES